MDLGFKHKDPIEGLLRQSGEAAAGLVLGRLPRHIRLVMSCRAFAVHKH